MAEETYSLPRSNSCYSTLEAYKQFVAGGIDDLWRAFHYSVYGGRIEQGSACCPELRQEALTLRPENTDWEALQTVRIPPGIASRQNICSAYLAYRDAPATTDPLAKKWVRQHETQRQTYWQIQYQTVAEKLHGCCVRHFDDCLQMAQRHAGVSALSPADALKSCVERFSPEHQVTPAFETAVAAGRRVTYETLLQMRKRSEQGETIIQAELASAVPADPLLQIRKILETVGGRQAPHAYRSALTCVQELTDVRKELAQCAGQQQAVPDVPPLLALAVRRIETAATGPRPGIQSAAAEQAIGDAAVICSIELGRAGHRLEECGGRPPPTAQAPLLAEGERGFWQSLSVCRTTLEKTQQERATLHTSLTQAEARSGQAALMDFPAGDMSVPMALCAAGAVVAGGLLGLPGRRQLVSGAVSALLALLIFLGIVAFLPAAHLLSLLLALFAALLPVSLRTLLRVAVLLRQPRKAGPLSP